MIKIVVDDKIKVEKNYDDADVEIIEYDDDLPEEVRSPKSPEASKPKLTQNISEPQLVSSIV